MDESQPPARIPMTRRLTLLLTLAASMVAGTAHAQFNRSDPATGEKYGVEIAYGWWKPAPTIQIASEGLGIPPTLIDFETDLGIESERVRELRVVLRPARKHKFKYRLPADQLRDRGPRPAADHRVQRPVLHGRGAGERRRQVHDPEDRLRVRLPLQGPRLPGLHPRHEDHAGPDRFRQPDQHRVRRGGRADPDGGPRRPRLRGAQRRVRRRVHLLPDPRRRGSRVTTARTSTTTSTGPSTSTTTPASPAAGGSWIWTTRWSGTSARSTCRAGTSRAS